MSVSGDDQPVVEPLLTVDEASALVKVKKSWVYDSVENGMLSSIRLGKQLRFRPSDLARYLDGRAKATHGAQRN